MGSACSPPALAAVPANTTTHRLTCLEARVESSKASWVFHIFSVRESDCWCCLETQLGSFASKVFQYLHRAGLLSNTHCQNLLDRSFLALGLEKEWKLRR